MRRRLTKISVLAALALLVTAVVVVAPSWLSSTPSSEVTVAGSTDLAASPSQRSESGATAVPTTAPVPLPTSEPTATPIPTVAAAVAVAPTATEIPVESSPQLSVEPTSTADAGQAPITTSVDSSTTGALRSAPVSTATPIPTPPPPPAPSPTSEPTAEPTASPTPESTATPEASPTPAPTITTEPTPTATAEPSPTPGAGYQVDAGWMWVDSDSGLMLRSDPAGPIVRALDHRSQVFATGQVLELEGREWMQVESPARGWVAREFLSITEPEAIVVVTPEPSGEPPTAQDWEALRQCESGGNYAIVSSNGLYHGAYQFLPSTWDTIAGRSGRPDLVGLLPSAASPTDQDAMAFALYQLQGASPWPVCGQALL